MKAAIIVAHPDDEMIWAGGLILRRRDWQWTVLSLCRESDLDRCAKFKRICSMLDIRGFICDLDDGNPLGAIDPGRDIGERVLGHLGGVEWPLCLTHGRNGEYGHERHRQVHGVVTNMVERGSLHCERFWTFAYEAGRQGGECRPASWADLTVALSAQELAEKKRIVGREYGYPKDGFEVRACISPEAFLRVKDVEEELVL